MRRWLLLSVLIGCTSAPATPDPAAEVSWLLGCWRSESEGIVTVERWQAAGDGKLVGDSRTTRGDELLASEKLTIEPIEGGYTYNSLPSGQSFTVFKSTTVQRGDAVFENPEHDYPQRILYRQPSADELHARIEGNVDGKLKSSEWSFRRCPD